MKTRKIIFLLPALFFFFSLRGLSEGINTAGTPMNLPSKEVIATMTEEQKQALVQQMKDRVEYIKAMDKSSLTKEEKKALRSELRAMKMLKTRILDISTDRTTGVVTVAVTMHNQKNELVLSGEQKYLLRKRSA